MRVSVVSLGCVALIAAVVVTGCDSHSPDYERAVEQREALAKKGANGDLSAMTRYRSFLDTLDITYDDRLALLRDFGDRVDELRPPPAIYRRPPRRSSTNNNPPSGAETEAFSDFENSHEDELAKAHEIAYGGCAGLTWEELKAEAGYRDGPASPTRGHVEWAAYLIEKRAGWPTGPHLRAAVQGCADGFYEKYGS